MNGESPLKAHQAVLFAAAGIALAAPAQTQGAPPAPVRVEALRLEEVQERRRVTGEIRAARRSRVAAEEAGLVIERAVEVGDAVEAGELLVRLDATRLELELRALEAERGQTQALLEERAAARSLAERDLETLEELTQRDAANPKELADGRSAVQIALARERQAQAQIELLEARAAILTERVSDTVTRAPFGGRVVRLETELGQWLNAGTPVVELISVELEAWFEVPQRHFAAVQHQRGPLEVTIDASGEALVLGDYRIVASVDSRSRTFAVAGALPMRPELAHGMSIEAWVPTGAAGSELTVSRDALMRNEVGSFVYLAMPGSEGQPATAAPIPVEVLFSVGERVVVRGAGLRPGAPAIVEGNERLFPGAPVIPTGGPPPDGGERDR